MSRMIHTGSCPAEILFCCLLLVLGLANNVLMYYRQGHIHLDPGRKALRRYWVGNEYTEVRIHQGRSSANQLNLLNNG